MVMPPKAKAKGKAKAKALPKAKAKGKAKARPKVLARPGANLRRLGIGRRGVLRRPSAVEDPAKGEGKGGVEDFETGKLVEGSKVSGLAWVTGIFVAFDGNYWQSPCQVAGYVEELLVEGDLVEVSLDLRGTTSERLLKWSSGHRLHRLRVHLCDPRCPSEKVGDDYFHGHYVRKIAEDQKQPWMLCLEEGKRDDLKDLRNELGGAAPVVPGPKMGKGSSSTSSHRGGKEKKKKKKKKRSAADKILEEREKEEANPGGSAPSGSRRFKGQASLTAVFGETGLDPSLDVRRKIKKKVRKAVKKKKKKDSSASTSTSSSGSQSFSMEGIFPETRRVRSVAKKAPGALASQSVEEMRDQLVTSSGQMWSQDVGGPVPPLVLHYFRSVMKSRMSGGMAREALTLAYVTDLGLQGRIAEALDVTLQRLKSLEMTSGGSDYRVSQRIELVPPEMEGVATNLQKREAILEAKEDERLRYQSGKGGDWYRSDSWKNHEKGWGKQAKGKDGKKATRIQEIGDGTTERATRKERKRRRGSRGGPPQGGGGRHFGW